MWAERKGAWWRSHVWPELAGVWALALLSGCGGGTTQLARRPPEQAAFVVVPSPPPVVPLEVQPARPSEEAAWLEGQWSWTNERWHWQPGGWIVPPGGATVSVWIYSYQADGRVRFWPSAWFDAAGQRMEAPRVIARARRHSERQ
jgi:hypothetical protein